MLVIAHEINQWKRIEEKVFSSKANPNRTLTLGPLGSEKLNLIRNRLAWSAEA